MTLALPPHNVSLQYKPSLFAGIRREVLYSRSSRTKSWQPVDHVCYGRHRQPSPHHRRRAAWNRVLSVGSVSALFVAPSRVLEESTRHGRCYPG